MSDDQGWNGRVVKSLFVSDVHLGCRHSQAGPFLELLERFDPRELYIVGDFIDGWKLKRKWRWLPVYDKILQRMMAMKRAGTKIYYTPGNHDEFLRGFLANFGVVEVKDTFVHQAADGRRLLIMHGDQFDDIEQRFQWVSLAASYAYDTLLSANWLVNKLRGKAHDPYAFCGAFKRRIKMLVRHVSEFESKLADAARGANCDGIVCGHIHAPRIMDIQGLSYCNTGDWVENCSALVEYEEGGFELIRRDGQVIDALPARQPAATPAENRPGVDPDSQPNPAAILAG